LLLFFRKEDLPFFLLHALRVLLERDAMHPPVIDAKPSALRDAVYVLYRRQGRIVFVTLAVLGACYLYGTVHGAQYTAEARLMVSPVGGGAGNGASARNEAEILSDPALMRRLVPVLRKDVPPPVGREAEMVGGLRAWWRARLVALGLARAGSEDARLGDRFARALGVRAVPDTDIIELRFAWDNPGFAALALNALLADQQRLAAGDAEATQAVVLAAARLHDAQARLAVLDERIAALPEIAGAAPDAGAIEREKDRVSSRIAAARSSADALRVERELAARKLEAAEKAYAGGGWVDNPDSPAASTGAAPVDETFVELLDKRAKLLAKLPEESPKVHAVDQEIAQAREHAYQAVRQVLGNRVRGIDDRLAALTAQGLADETALRGLDDRLVQLEALQGSRQGAAVQVAEATRALDEQRREAETAVHQAAGLRVLSEASAPAEADWPSPLVLVWAGGVSGLALGLGSALLAERRRRTIDRPQDILRVLKIPVLASVPELR